MNHLNTSIVYAGIILIAQVLLMQACGNDVGGNEDTTPSVVTINAITDANDDGEIIGQATILWTTDEPNPSTVDIFLSSDSGTTFDTTIALNVPDTGEYVWDTNSVNDCRACRLRIIATDIARNVGGPAESVDDFIINNSHFMRPQTGGFQGSYTGYVINSAHCRQCHGLFSLYSCLNVHHL